MVLLSVPPVLFPTVVLALVLLILALNASLVTVLLIMLAFSAVPVVMTALPLTSVQHVVVDTTWLMKIPQPVLPVSTTVLIAKTPIPPLPNVKNVSLVTDHLLLPPPHVLSVLSLAVPIAMVILLPHVIFARQDTSLLILALPALMTANGALMLPLALFARTLMVSFPLIKRPALSVTKLLLALLLLPLLSFLSSSR